MHTEKLIKFHQTVPSFLYINKKTTIDFLDFEETLSYRSQMMQGSYRFQESCTSLSQKMFLQKGKAKPSLHTEKALRRDTSKILKLLCQLKLKLDFRIIRNHGIPFKYPSNFFLNVYVFLESSPDKFKKQEDQCTDGDDKGTILLVKSHFNFKELGIFAAKYKNNYEPHINDVKTSTCQSSKYMVYS